MKKLYLSDHDKKIGGVCGGLADYFDIDPIILRIIWFVAICCYGTGLLLYLGYAFLVRTTLDTNSNGIRKIQ